MDYKNYFFKTEVEPALKNAATAEDMLEILHEHYHLDDPLKMMTHLAFRQGLRTAIVLLNPEPKASAEELN